MKPIKHASLFSGIGGFDLAADRMGWKNVLQVENDEECRKILSKNFPNTKRYHDIKDFDGIEYRGTIDIITGGFPCQPFSKAGKRRGKSDDRYLWPEFNRVVGEIKPTFVVAENVPGIISMELDQVLSDLENQDYSAWPVCIPACAVEADSIRQRVWIIAIANGLRAEEAFAKITFSSEALQEKKERKFYGSYSGETWAETIRNYTTVFGELYGIPHWMDRIKGLGNAIDPRVAYKIFKVIENIHHGGSYKSGQQGRDTGLPLHID